MISTNCGCGFTIPSHIAFIKKKIMSGDSGKEKQAEEHWGIQENLATVPIASLNQLKCTK